MASLKMNGAIWKEPTFIDRQVHVVVFHISIETDMELR